MNKNLKIGFLIAIFAIIPQIMALNIDKQLFLNLTNQTLIQATEPMMTGKVIQEDITHDYLIEYAYWQITESINPTQLDAYQIKDYIRLNYNQVVWVNTYYPTFLQAVFIDATTPIDLRPYGYTQTPYIVESYYVQKIPIWTQAYNNIQLFKYGLIFNEYNPFNIQEQNNTVW